MATSNRDRVGRGFELLAEGLEPFVDRHMSAAAAKAGVDWAQLIEARDQARHGTAKSFDRHDPAVQLRVITEEWRVFKESLSRAEQSFASELRDTRNSWAHNATFSPDDTYRALDTMERLLTAAGAASQAEQVRRLRADHQRAVFEAETRRIVKQQEAGVTVAGQGLKPWREVLAPHEDVATGNFSASEFAADLHVVAQGEGGEEYADPVQFFRRTFLTEGLRELLDRAVRRVSGDLNASPIINLQTNFGGGKTHSLLALWHLLSGAPVRALPQEVQDLVADRPLPALVRRVALVGTHLSPAGASEKPDGTRVATLWGRAGLAARRPAGVRRGRRGRRRRHEPGRGAAGPDRRARAVPNPHRRVGRLRPPAVGPRGSARWHVRHPVHVRAVADRSRQDRARRTAGHLHPRIARP